MNIFRYELKKLLLSPAVLIFLTLCLGFNVLIMSSDFDYDYSDYVADASKTTGVKLGTGFEEKIAQLRPGDDRDYYEADTKGWTDVFDDYDTAYIAKSYINYLGLTGKIEQAMLDKYDELQKSVDKKAITDESLTLYFASSTYDKHLNLYGSILNITLLECGLLAALIMLLSLGYEHSNRTSQIVYATRTGRKLLRHKLGASIAASLVAYTILMALTLIIYFTLNNYGSIWSSSVSSVFNYVQDTMAGIRPFITWQSYSVLTYLLAVLGIAAVVTLCFALLAFNIGVWFKNSYIGFAVFLIVNAAEIALAIGISVGIVKYCLVLSPVILWLKQSLWFTDGGADILWKNFETIGAFASFLLLAGLCMLSAVLFKRRDIT